MNRLKRAFSALAAGSVIVGGIVLGTAAIASAHTATPSDPVSSCTSPLNSTWQGSGTVKLALTNDNATISVTSVTAGTVNLSNPYTSSTAGVSHVITITGIPDATSSVTVHLHVLWTDEYSVNTSFTVTEPEGGCVPSPVVPTLNLTATASPQCGDFTVPVVLTESDGANLVGDDGDGVVTSIPGIIDIVPGGTYDGSVVFPASDAGKTETVNGIVGLDGFSSYPVASNSFKLPAVCTTTVTVPVPGPTTTVTVPVPTPPTVVTVPCYGNVTNDGYTGTYGGACPVPPVPAPAAPVAAPAPAVAHAAVVPVGAPQTGFGGAAQSSNNDGWLYAGGGLILFGLLSALAALRLRKRDA